VQLKLIVNNTHDLGGSTIATASFNEGGGIIGSDETADWILSDRQGSVRPHHVHIHHLDGQFCLEATAEADTYINDASMPMAAGEMVQISDGDRLRLGIFNLQAYVLDNPSETGQDDGIKTQAVPASAAWLQRFAPVATLVSDADNEAHHNLFETEIMKGQGGDLRERLASASRRDPVEMMEESSSSRTTIMKDPLAAFERDRLKEHDIMASKVGEILQSEVEEAHYIEVPDDLMPGSASVAAPVMRTLEDADYDDIEPLQESYHQESRSSSSVKKTGQRSNHEMDDYLEMLARSAPSPHHTPSQHHELPDEFYGEVAVRLSDANLRDSYLGDVDEEIQNDGPLVDHVVMRPLCQALGLDIHQMSVPQANRLASDIGAALKVAIDGLMQAHRQEMANKSHLAETHLHAIEDNPLRLDQTVEAAIKDLFLIQSPVHLSAQAAIGESLELLRHHRAASEVATEAALALILKALSPLNLARRFMKYKGHAPRSGDLDAWHWKMYQHYYAEMRSDQQGGLSRLFWEVYRQIYDREMRQRTMEQT